MKSRDNVVWGVVVYLGKTIERPINKLYPIEFQDEFKVNSDNSDMDNSRPARQQTVILTNLKRKYIS